MEWQNPPWPEDAPGNRPAEPTRGSKLWSWWLGKHLTRFQKVLLLVLVLPPVALTAALKFSWDAQNRAKAEREWIEHKKKEKDLMEELRRLEEDAGKIQLPRNGGTPGRDKE